jgi:orotidine-5'-phosphate decarboxylase
MNREQLIEEIRKKGSFLCVGLDPDTEKIPEQFLQTEDPIYEFNKAIIDATADYCVAFKPNSAFFEAYGISGLESMDKTFRYIRHNYPNHFLIADAKRGDIGNTSTMYAKAFFSRMNAHAVTVSPYMGKDSVSPFLDFDGMWTIVLALTSNSGSSDFQKLLVDGKPLYMHVMEQCMRWGTESNLMFVVGATHAETIGEIRKTVPNHFMLIPGVGTQGGSLSEVCKFGLNKDIGLLINASRSIIYASKGADFAEAAMVEAKRLAKEMKTYIK